MKTNSKKNNLNVRWWTTLVVANDGVANVNADVVI